MDNPTFSSNIIDRNRSAVLEKVKYFLILLLFPLGFVLLPQDDSGNIVGALGLNVLAFFILFLCIGSVAYYLHTQTSEVRKIGQVMISSTAITIDIKGKETVVYPIDKVQQLVIERGASYHRGPQDIEILGYEYEHTYDYDNWVKFRTGDQNIAYEFAITSKAHNEIFVQVLAAIRDKGYAFKFLSV